MTGGELSTLMTRLVERLEREPRFSLAWEIAYGMVLRRVEYLPVEEWPAKIEEETKRVLEEIGRTNALARSRRRARGFANLTDRIDRLARGEKLPDTRRRRRRKTT